MITWSPHWNNDVSQVGWCGPQQWVWAETADSGLYFVTALTSGSWISFSVSVCPIYYRHLISDYYYLFDILQGVNKMAKEEEAYKWSTEDMWFSQIVELHICLASILSKSAAPDRLSRTRHHCRFVEMISMQAVSRTLMRMSFKPQNQQQLLTARSFCTAPPIAERIQVMTQSKLIHLDSPNICAPVERFSFIRWLNLKKWGDFKRRVWWTKIRWWFSWKGFLRLPSVDSAML